MSTRVVGVRPKIATMAQRSNILHWLIRISSYPIKFFKALQFLLRLRYFFEVRSSENAERLNFMSDALAESIDFQLDATSKLSTELEVQSDHLTTLRQGISQLNKQIETLGTQFKSQHDDSLPIVLTTGYGDTKSPEIQLLIYLSEYLSKKVMIDVGAHTGGMSLPLLDSGLEVYAFEPYPPSYDKLVDRLGDTEGFHALSIAIGAEDGSSILNVVQLTENAPSCIDASQYHSLIMHPTHNDVTFSDTFPVKMRSLKSLAESKLIPLNTGIIKIDTEGYDLRVIEGMGSCTCEILLVEFWQEGHVFYGPETLNKIEPSVREMNERGYSLFIVLPRIDWKCTYHCNNVYAPRGSWGNVIFFRRATLFAEALRWCTSALEPTSFGT